MSELTHISDILPDVLCWLDFDRDEEMTDLFPKVCKAKGLPVPVSEFAFAKDAGRRWRFDFAFVDERVAVEVEGGIWIRGRHSRGKGMLSDMQKYNEAAVRGWCALRTTPDSLMSAEMFEMIERAVKSCNHTDKGCKLEHGSHDVVAMCPRPDSGEAGTLRSWGTH